MSRRIDQEGSSQRDGPTSPQGGWVLSRDAVREVDRLAVERFGVPSIVLMENAAIGLRDRALAMLAGLGGTRAAILAGPGNNGGDGFALARHLHNAGREPAVLITGDPARYAGDAATNLAIVRRMGLSIARLDTSAGAEILEQLAANPVLIVDALLGTGVREAARGVIRDVILQVNRLRSAEVGVLAVDVPSGLDCDTGEPAGGGEAVAADATVTFVALKRGFLHLDAQRWTGEISVAGIGAPRELVEELGEFVPDTRPGAHSGETTPPRLEDPPGAHDRGGGTHGGQHGDRGDGPDGGRDGGREG